MLVPLKYYCNIKIIPNKVNEELNLKNRKFDFESYILMTMICIYYV